MFKEVDNALVAELTFTDFEEAFAFMTDVAGLAEEMNHHPDWSNSYNRVTIKLSTHSANSKITDKDRKMADAIANLPGAAFAEY